MKSKHDIDEIEAGLAADWRCAFPVVEWQCTPPCCGWAAQAGGLVDFRGPVGGAFRRWVGIDFRRPGGDSSRRSAVT
jgi:hypothetical protein